jgi:ring-1,2-phenylacetyl-CoA epoxidase subunit PaaD
VVNGASGLAPLSEATLREAALSETPLTEARAWEVLASVLDPEVPVLSVVELGIVRSVQVDALGAVTVAVTPTYSGCPATEVINEAIATALREAGAEVVEVTTRLSPPWTSDWIGKAAREKLRHYGIAPPHLSTPDPDAPWSGEPRAVSQALRFHPRNLSCPRCQSQHTEQLSAFGSTACKALYRCLDCREPFEYFKPI